MTFRKSLACVVLSSALLLLVACGGSDIGSGDLIPAAHAQTKLPPMPHWGGAVILDPHTVAFGFEFIGQAGDNPQTSVQFPIPPGVTRVVSLQGNASFTSVCGMGGTLVAWRFTPVGPVYTSILKEQFHTSVNLPLHFTIPTPIDSGDVGWLTIGTGVRNCPSGGSYFSNNVPYADTEVQGVIQFE